MNTIEKNSKRIKCNEFTAWRKNHEKKLTFNKFLLIYFLIAFIPRFALIQFMYPLNTPLDETSTLALPAYLVGYDWSYLMGRTKMYYGYGMSVLFTPLFLAVKDPIMLYRLILTACALLQTIPGFIAFHILGTFFGQKNNYIKLLLALIATYCVSTTATNVYNEHMLYIIAWVVGWMILALINCKSILSKDIYTFVLSFILFYSLTCHARAKVFIMALIGVIIIYWLFQRKLLISPIVFMITSSIMYKITHILTSKVQSIIWPITTSGEALNNTSTVIPFKLLKNKESWYVWVNIILGQLGTGAVFTGGILLLAIVFGIYMLVKKIIAIRTKNDDVNDNYFYVILFGLMTIGATIFAQSITWLENAQNAIADSVASEGGRAFTYLRYFFPCVSLVVVLSLNRFVSDSTEKKNNGILKVAWILVVLLQINFVFAIIPLIEKTPLINYIHKTYWNFSFTTDGDWTCRNTFLPACIVCVILFSFLILLIMKAKKITALFFVVMLLGYQYVMSDIGTGISKSVKNFHEVRETWDVLSKMEEDDMLPEYIGVTGQRIQSTNQPLRFIYQYLLQEHRISYFEQAVGISEAIYLKSSIDTDDIITNDHDIWYGIELSDNQYILFKGNILETYFREEGYKYFIIK